MWLSDGEAILDQVVLAVQKVRERLLRTARILDQAQVSYAVAGGNAVAAWVGRVNPSAIRFTQDVDILLRRADLAEARAALEPEGFVFRHAGGMDFFLDGADGGVRDAVHLIFAQEKVRAHEAMPNPDVTQSVELNQYRVLSLEALVQIKLTAFRRKDQVHLLDLLTVGLIDQTWTARYPLELAERLQSLIDDPNG